MVAISELQPLWYIGHVSGCIRTMTVVHSRQVGLEKMPEHIGGLSLKGSSTEMLSTNRCVPIKRWNKLG